VDSGTTRWSPAQRWVVGLTATASFIVALDMLVVSTALSAIRADLGASLEQLEWTVNAYTLTFAVLLMTGAALGDRFGRRRMFAAGMSLFAAASMACALAPDAGWLIAARAVQGAGAAVVMPLALTLLGGAFAPQARARAIGIFTAVVGASVPLGPLVGGAVVEGISWSWIFWLNVPLALALIPLALTRLEESRGAETALDIPGLALVTGAGFGIVWGLVRGNAAGWGSLEVVTTLAMGALLAAAFVVCEQRTREPMLPMSLFHLRPFSGGNGALFFLWASTFGALFFFAQFLQTGLGSGPLETGVQLMPWGATTIVVPRIAAGLIGRLGERPFVLAGITLHGAAMAWIALIAAPGLAYAELVPPMVVSGAGIAMAIPAIQSAVLGSVPPRSMGKASGTLSTARQLGGAFGVAVLVAVFAGGGSYASAGAFSDGFALALAASAALALGGVGAGLALPGRRRARYVAAAPIPATADADAGG
jgi:EmrB/QacA subfamily drug resistance transporter